MAAMRAEGRATAGMRGQLSVEFMVYAALATASLVVSLRLFSLGAHAQAGAAGKAYAEELAALVDSNMGYSSSLFSAYVPSGVCGAASGGGGLEMDNLTVELASNVSIDAPALCAGSGGVERLLLYRLGNGTYELTAGG